MDLQKIGACLRDLRKEKGLTQEQLAEQFHVSQRTVSRWETGSVTPELDVLLQLADFYEVDLRTMLDGEPIKAQMTHETKETVQQIVIFNQVMKERALRERRIRVWAGSYLAVCLLNILISLIAFDSNIIVVFGPLSPCYSIAANYGESAELIYIAYFLFLIAFAAFAYTMTFVKGKGLWFLILRCIDISACLIIFLFESGIEAAAENWCGLAIQIIHAALFFFVNYIWKREKQAKSQAYAT
jgi:transcriptional regulator with XRE-family HTH domain